MEILKPEQMDKIEEFLKNQRDNSPLVIIGPNNFKRNDFLNKICTKFTIVPLITTYYSKF